VREPDQEEIINARNDHGSLVRMPEKQILEQKFLTGKHPDIH